MSKNMRVIKELIKLRFHNLMMFQLGFFGPFFVDGSLFVVQLLVFQAIYANVERIGTWEKGEMIIFIGTFSVINALNMIIFFFGINGIPDKIKTGEIDLYLTKPVSPLLRLTFEAVNPGSVPLLIMGILIIGYGVKIGNISINGKNIGIYIFWVILMTVLWYEMEVIIRSIAYFVVSTANISRLEEAGIDLCMKIPGIVFKGIYKFIFYFILPYGIMATFPTLSLVGEGSMKMMLFGIGVVLLFGIVTAVLWKTGIKQYNSVSS